MVFVCQNSAEMLAELSRREKEANIRPDPDVDIYMKVKPLLLFKKKKILLLLNNNVENYIRKRLLQGQILFCRQPI